MKFGQLFAQTTASTPASVKDQVRARARVKEMHEKAPADSISTEYSSWISSGFDESLLEKRVWTPFWGAVFWLESNESILRDDAR